MQKLNRFVSGYYLAIRRASLLGNAEPFIDFMLERILETIKTKGDAEQKNVGVNVGVKLSVREGSDKSGVWGVKAL